MPDSFISVPIETDEVQLYNIAIARIQQEYPNWTPRPGSLADMILRIGAGWAAIGAETASTVIPDIFRYFGALAQIPPHDAQQAIGSVRITVQDAAGYSIPAQTPIGLKTAGMDQPLGFYTQNQLDIGIGDTTGDVGIVAITEGAQANGLNLLTRVDSLSYVTDIALLVPPFNGEDAELTTDYLNRLSLELELWTTTPITGPNFAAVLTKVDGIYRAAYWDNYNPEDETTDNEKYVTTCPINKAGSAVGSTVKTNAQNLLLGLREVGFVAPVVDPTPNEIDVSYTAYSTDPTIDAAIADALGGFLDPATWGMPRVPARPVPIWVNTPTVYLNDIIQVIQMVIGVVRAADVEIAIHGDSLSAADVTMDGAFPLPTLGTVTPTILSP